MSVKANWFSVVKDDATAEEEVTPTEEHYEALFAELKLLTDREGELYNCSITCPIRDAQGTSCASCPLAHHADRLHPLQPLCVVGRRAERVTTEMAIAQAQMHPQAA